MNDNDHNPLDYIGNRTCLAALLGGLAGASHALLQGHASVSRTASLTAASCAVTATTLVGCQQGVLWLFLSDYQPRRDALLLSHAGGGLLGGGLLGLLYQQKPVRGALVLGPLLLAFGVGQVLWEDVVLVEEERRKQE